MTISWSTRRKLLYYGVGLIIVVVVAWLGYGTFLSMPATCQDGAQDGDEHGVDCGGSCALMCPNESHAPVVLWARSFAVSEGSYTAAAYIQNNNPGAGAHKVGYSFQLLDQNGALIVERDGVAELPPVSVVPIVETGIKTGSRTVARTLFAFAQEPLFYKARALPLSVSGESLSGDGTQLTATLKNDSRYDVPAVAVAAVLFDSRGVARAASRSIIAAPHGVSVPLVFTWPAGVPDVARAEITALPPF